MADETSLPRGAICVTLLVPDTADGTSVVLSWVRWHLRVGFSHLFLFFDLPPAAVDDSVTLSAEARATGCSHFASADSSSVPTTGADSNLPPRSGLPDHGAARAVAREFASDGFGAAEGTGSATVTVIAGRAPEVIAWQALHCPSWRTLRPYASKEVPARQCLNAETAAVLCPGVGCTWLLHLDIDELFYTGPPVPKRDGSIVYPQVGSHFASLESEGCEALTYMNHEGVPEKEAVGDYFKEVTLFRRHHFCTPLTLEAREAMAFWSQRTGHGQYLLVYDCGKSVAKVQLGLRAASVHNWALPPSQQKQQQQQRRPRSRTALADPRALDVASLRIVEWPCVLHYPCCGLGWLSAKYHILGRFEASWAGLPIAPSFHLDARDAVLGKEEALDGGDGTKPIEPTIAGNGGSSRNNNDGTSSSENLKASSSSLNSGAPTLPGAADSSTEATQGIDNARAFYRAQVLFDTNGAHALELDRQLRSTVCMRVDHIANALGSASASDSSGSSSGSSTATHVLPSQLPTSTQSSNSSRAEVGSDSTRAEAAAPPPPVPPPSSKDDNVAALTRATDALALVGAHFAAGDEAVRSRDNATSAAGPVGSTAAAEGAPASPADNTSAAPAAPAPGSRDLGCQKAWILSSVAQQYL